MEWGRSDYITVRDYAIISNKISIFISSAEVSVNAEEDKITGADFREFKKSQ